jgi:hypothetical protein
MAASDFKGNITVVREKVPKTFKAHEKIVTSLAFNSDGSTLASASLDGSIQLRSWDGKTWNSSPRSLTTQSKSIRSIAFSPIDNRTLVSGDDDGVIMFWDVSAGTQVGTLPKQKAAVNSVAFSPDGKMLASGSEDSRILLWNVATRQPLGSALVGQRDSVLSVAFSPDSKLLASGGMDNAVILWNVATGELLYSFHEHTASVWSVAFSPDGKELASCSRDRSIILWDVAARESISPLETEDHDMMFAVAFRPDGQLASAGWGVTYWDVSLDSLRRNAEYMAARNLRPDEWKHFFGERSYRLTSESPHFLLKSADTLALMGDKNAEEAFKKVVDLAIKSNDVDFNNEVGWRGILDHLAGIVLPACDRAVELAKGQYDSSLRDTRGVARAMTGKFPEAIEDFQAAVTWFEAEEDKAEKAKEESGSQAEKEEHERIAAEWKKMRVEREEWIGKLKSRQNPFDDETLKTLRKESVPTSE